MRRLLLGRRDEQIGDRSPGPFAIRLPATAADLELLCSAVVGLDLPGR